MGNEIPFYILWGKYYNPVLDTYTEKMLGCYKEESITPIKWLILCEK